MQADTSTNAAGGFCSLAVIDGLPAISEYYVSFGDLFYVRALDQDGGTWSAPRLVNDGVALGWYTTLAECTTTNTVPVITHFDSSSQQILFERANDAAGTSWVAPMSSSNPGDCIDSASMAMVGGLPALAYFGLDQFAVPGLNYIRATDSSFVWGSLQQLVTGGDNGLRPCIAEVGGFPAVAYKYRVEYVPETI